ncbi:MULTISPECIES: hypothetical protein [unclassified Variovorax]|uniref:hypothetical protein n=1 Tax=unclassified Variovorax TaxID=663243 RepID=UPI0008B87A11|nr:MULTISPECIES: hypothetical protein [unclassified Variovorax]SEJ95357.1 hypothetical protein SAMN05518853_105105 [Variovorax sp. OK202]SFD19062.1 hypothetical protein SAMN05444746_105145 [Variovorax sp. OK212]
MTGVPPAYMSEPWFALLQAACAQRLRSEVAAQLRLSPAAVSQVLNASGKYGAGKARTDRIARRVLDTFGAPAAHEEARA